MLSLRIMFQSRLIICITVFFFFIPRQELKKESKTGVSYLMCSCLSNIT
ncbi:hypothetical protein OIU74_017698 [Salix koriyanagi]|uniref:Uncharacterized protein n=1 Tax=Salix koriyanagi TaxID=2511006 RepID=A0A9Q0WTA5_9ROSI|nr:hypothetical protein OIU74_017698 [Salix koriyanagi]